MLRRKIYDYLLNWKSTKKNECLIIKGARQVGKTFIVQEFGRENYKYYLEVNFILQPELKSVFSGSLDVDTILMNFSFYFRDAVFVPGETLIFLDEIQTCPEARTALKSFALDNRFDVIASGSLLGLHYGQDDEIREEIPSVPVGYEREVYMHSLDFMEFLWAEGISDSQISYIKGFLDREEMIPSDINERLLYLFRLYAVVGGMPAVVASFIENANMDTVQKEQEKILSSYGDDIARHAKGTEKQKVRKCWESIPRQLAKENRKFQFSKVEHGGNSRKYSSSVQWLSDAALVNVCRNVSTPQFPLSAYDDDSYFKVYVNDTGLLCAMYGFSMKAAVVNKSLDSTVKGAIYENLIAEQLVKNGHKLFCYKKGESEQEIEFLIDRDAVIIPVEVKAKNGASYSLNQFIKKYHPGTGYKLVDGNIGREGEKLTIPHYLVMFL